MQPDSMLCIVQFNKNPQSRSVVAVAFPAMVFGDDLEGAHQLLDFALAPGPSNTLLYST